MITRGPDPHHATSWRVAIPVGCDLSDPLAKSSLSKAFQGDLLRQGLSTNPRTCAVGGDSYKVGDCRGREEEAETTGKAVVPRALRQDQRVIPVLFASMPHARQLLRPGLHWLEESLGVQAIQEEFRFVVPLRLV